MIHITSSNDIDILYCHDSNILMINKYCYGLYKMVDIFIIFLMLSCFSCTFIAGARIRKTRYLLGGKG